MRLNRSMSAFVLLITAGAVALLSTLIAGGLVYRSTRGLILAAGWVAHTQEVLNSLQDAAQLTERVEDSTRPYALSGPEERLRAARSSARQLNALAAHLKLLVSDNANQDANVVSLTACAAELDHVLNGLSATTAFPADQIGRCQQTMNLMTQQEKALLKQRIDRSRHLSFVSFTTEIAFIALTFLTLIVLFFFLLRDAVLRERIGGKILKTQLDLTRLNQTLVKSEEWFRGMIEASPNAMVMTDSAGKVEMVNAEMEHVFGYPRSELLGMSIEKLIPERFRAASRDEPLKTPARSKVSAGDWEQFYGERKDGAEFPFEIRLNQVEMSGGTKVLSAIVDISDRRQKEKRIEAALREKDILLGEIHHRVKNNLQIVHSLLDLQSARIQDPQVLAMLRDSQHRIRSMALIHQTLYQSNDFAEVDFGSFLNSLIPILVESYLERPERVSLTIDARDMHLPIHAAIPCGLLVNELISNCLKHAFPGERRGKIKIEFVHSAEGVQLSVSDDGVGIAEGFDLVETESLGLQLVFLLTDQLGGKMTVQRSNPTCFVLRFTVEDASVSLQRAPNGMAREDDHCLTVQ